jgi:putative thioredoxin
MADSPFISEATRETFAERVLVASRRVPVLVDFWAAWCGPCQMLMPILARLAEQYQGKFLLVKVNTDEQQELAMQYGVRSLPTLKLFRDGAAVEEIIGAQPEGALRGVLDRHITRESDLAMQQAQALFAQGQTVPALEAMHAIAASDPDNERVRLELVRMLMNAGQTEAAQQALDELPPNVRLGAEGNELAAQMQFVQAVAGAPPMAQLEAALAAGALDSRGRYQLGALRVLTGDYEGALQVLLDLMKRDRQFDEGAPKKALLAVFELLGGEHPLTAQYRRQMFALLY